MKMEKQWKQRNMGQNRSLIFPFLMAKLQGHILAALVFHFLFDFCADD